MKTKTTTARPAERPVSPPDELKTAYQAHTLAQMLRAHLAAPAWTPTVPAPYPPVFH